MRILFFFLLLLVSAWAGIQLSKDPGQLFISINHWTLETTLITAIIALLLLFTLIHCLLVLLNKITNYPAKLRHLKAKKRAQRAQATTRRGLIEFSEGDWSAAKNHLMKALPDADTPLLNYLTAARAAQEMGDNHMRDHYLREAQQSMPDARIAVELTQAQLQLANHQWEQALATLKHLQDLAPQHPYVLKLLMQLYQEIKDWPQLIKLLPELKKNQILTHEEFENLKVQTYLQAMSDVNKMSLKAVEQLIAELPRDLKDDPRLISRYCEFLIKNNQQSSAEVILRRCLKKYFNNHLIALYGKINVNEQQLDFAGSLLKKHANSAALMLCMGRLSIAHHQWDKAREYLEKSLILQSTPEGFAELGSLLLRSGNQTEACQAFQRGLNLILSH